LQDILGKLKELETTSHSSSKIGLSTIEDSIKNLEVLQNDVEKQIGKLQNNFPQS
jgi:hypothetical protein